MTENRVRDDQKKGGVLSGMKAEIINQQTALLGNVNDYIAEGHHLFPSTTFRQSAAVIVLLFTDGIQRHLSLVFILFYLHH